MATVVRRAAQPHVCRRGLVRAFALVGAMVFAASLASGIWLYVSLRPPGGSAAPIGARPAAVAVLANSAALSVCSPCTIACLPARAQRPG